MSKKPFDRKAHCRRIGAKGGRATVAKHGSSHMSQIGVRGFRATAKHFRSVRDYKHWLASMGSAVYWQSSGLPNTGKFPSEPPAAPWQPDYTEF